MLVCLFACLLVCLLVYLFACLFWAEHLGSQNQKP